MESLKRGKPQATENPYLREIYKGEQFTTLSICRVYQPHRVLGVCCPTSMAQLTHALAITLYPMHTTLEKLTLLLMMFYTPVSVCPMCIYTHTPYGLFTNTIPNGTVTLLIDIALNQFIPIRLLFESIRIYSATTESNNRFDFSASAKLLSTNLVLTSTLPCLRLLALSQPNSRLLPQEGHNSNRILVTVLTFFWEWHSHHPFSTNFFVVVVIPVGHLDFEIYNNEISIATMMLWALGLDPLHVRSPIWHTHPTFLPRYMVTMPPWDHHYGRHS